MKLKNLYHATHTDAQPRWVWKLVWQAPVSRKEKSQRIGYYCRARDRWKAPGKRLVHLDEKEDRKSVVLG